MTTITFYQAQEELYMKSCCQIVCKCYESSYVEGGLRTIVRCVDDITMENLDNALWTFSQKYFIPHATHKDLLPEEQPVLLTTMDKNVNNASILVILDSDYSDIDMYSRVLVIFTAKSAQSTYAKYQEFLEQGVNTVAFHTQAVNGTWA